MPFEKRINKHITIRQADEFDIPFLRRELAKRPQYEQVDLNHAIIMIAEYDGVPFTFQACRATLQFEPLVNFNEDLPLNARRRGALECFRAMEEYVSDTKNNDLRVPTIWCHILDEPVWNWVEKLGMHRLYPGGRLYAKDLTFKAKS